MLTLAVYFVSGRFESQVFWMRKVLVFKSHGSVLSCGALLLLEARGWSEYSHGSVPVSDMSSVLTMAWTFVVMLRLTCTGVKSCSPVFLFRVLPLTRSLGDARPVTPQRHSFALRTVTFVSLTQRNGLRGQHFLLTLLLKVCLLVFKSTVTLLSWCFVYYSIKAWTRLDGEARAWCGVI